MEIDNVKFKNRRVMYLVTLTKKSIDKVFMVDIIGDSYYSGKPYYIFADESLNKDYLKKMWRGKLSGYKEAGFRGNINAKNNKFFNTYNEAEEFLIEILSKYVNQHEEKVNSYKKILEKLKESK